MSFSVALSGLNAATTDLNVISNNIANANTTGFKDSRAEFGDLIQGSVYSVASISNGNGVTAQRIAQQFTQGTITSTNNPLDIALNGNGFFTLAEPGAQSYSYTRNGAFSTDKDGYVVNAKGLRLQVYPPVANSNTFSTGTLSDLQISLAPNPPKATTGINAGVTLPVSATAPTTTAFDPADPTSYNVTTALTAYDSLGVSHNVGLYFSQTATAGSWMVHPVIDGTDLYPPSVANPTGGTPVTFDSTGKLLTPAGGSITLPTFTPTDGANPINITLDIGSTIQYGNNFSVNALTQDGYTTGTLSGVQISQQGVVTATYTNGQNVSLGQVALASFANSQGLQQLGNATWVPTFDSGQALPGVAGSTNLGTLQSGALESSNTDLTAQLVDMMTAQRNYQANAQVISTEDQLLQSILQLR